MMAPVLTALAASWLVLRVAGPGALAAVVAGRGGVAGGAR